MWVGLSIANALGFPRQRTKQSYCVPYCVVMLMARLMTAVVTLNLNMYVCQITSNFLAVYTGHTCIRIPISLMKIFNESIECRSTGKEVACERLRYTPLHLFTCVNIFSSSEAMIDVDT